MEFLSSQLPVILCIIIGIVFWVVEAFMPGFGVAGLAGTLLLGAAVVLLWIQHGALVGFGALIAMLAVIGLIILIIVKRYSKGKSLNKNFVLQGSSGKEKENNIDVEKIMLDGMEGTTLTVLRPSGIAVIEGKRVNVVSDGDFISEGAKVKVVAVEGTRVIVKVI